MEKFNNDKSGKDEKAPLVNKRDEINDAVSAREKEGLVGSDNTTDFDNARFNMITGKKDFSEYKPENVEDLNNEIEFLRKEIESFEINESLLKQEERQSYTIANQIRNARLGKTNRSSFSFDQLRTRSRRLDQKMTKMREELNDEASKINPELMEKYKKVQNLMKNTDPSLN
ncbi:MAG: hypothetical protein ACI88L_000466 [Candidatus Paceibacteria bacterium]|jgi:hypothetical protein